MSDALLQVEELCVSYGTARAVSRVSLSVAPGAAVAILGANGAGKSSFGQAVCGLTPAASGRVRFAGADISGQSATRISPLGLAYLPEGRGIFPGLSVNDNLRVMLRPVGGAKLAAALDEAYVLFPRLGERRRQIARTLSGGEQQMLALARVLVTRSKLVIADEPSLGLAPKLIELIFETLAKAREGGTAIVLIEAVRAPRDRVLRARHDPAAGDGRLERRDERDGKRAGDPLHRRAGGVQRGLEGRHEPSVARRFPTPRRLRHDLWLCIGRVRTQHVREPSAAEHQSAVHRELDYLRVAEQLPEVVDDGLIDRRVVTGEQLAEAHRRALALAEARVRRVQACDVLLRDRLGFAGRLARGAVVDHRYAQPHQLEEALVEDRAVVVAGVKRKLRERELRAMGPHVGGGVVLAERSDRAGFLDRLAHSRVERVWPHRIDRWHASLLRGLAEPSV